MRTHSVQDIDTVFKRQKVFFQSGNTRCIEFRLEKLKQLRNLLLSHEQKIENAIRTDLGKCPYSSFFSELGISYWELDFAIKKLKRWAKPKKVSIPVYHKPGKGYIEPEPYGVSLIIAPWNYPFHLNIVPLIGLISAGNCGIVKPSEHAPATAEVLEEIINDSFPPEYVHVITGDHTAAENLLEKNFDFIFYTGGTEIGKLVAQKAASKLIPYMLELGGKNPCIVDDSADTSVAARRIVWGKYFNAGQSCVAPDYIAVHHTIKDELLVLLEESIRKFYGNDPGKSPDYERIITGKHVIRLKNLLSDGKIITGGEVDVEGRYVAPTIIDKVDWDGGLMKDEIFGPLLPVIGYSDIEEVLSRIGKYPKPLALYVFSKNKRVWKRITEKVSSGTVCVNDVMLQSSIKTLPFGGVGESGSGRYHGEKSFLSFSNERSILERSFFFDLSGRYPPYKDPRKSLKKIVRFLS